MKEVASAVVHQSVFDYLRLVYGMAEKVSGEFCGIPIYVSPFMPKNAGVLMDSNGNVIKIFTMEESHGDATPVQRA